ncbi:hypothetical protein RJ639_014338 [Escallonia herrerae]|uniref:Non-specific lipid-transfer protein n=1 Tax=Escallonia herrerae TaxID=1293975 RepID=A0AA88VFC6_9ASTE|nr:hypothetical protein RJ639_014338 [Escallonia herrerae]
MKSLFVSMVLLLSVLFFLANVSDAVSCGDVAMKAASCVKFATGKDAKPAPTCCNGLQQLAGTVRSLDDKKAICRCLKNGVKNFSGVQDKYLSQIPTACKIKVGFPVSLNRTLLTAALPLDSPPSTLLLPVFPPRMRHSHSSEPLSDQARVKTEGFTRHFREIDLGSGQRADEQRLVVYIQSDDLAVREAPAAVDVSGRGQLDREILAAIEEAVEVD